MTDQKRPLTPDDLLRDLEKDMESAAGNPLLGLFYLQKSMARARALVAEMDQEIATAIAELSPPDPSTFPPTPCIRCSKPIAFDEVRCPACGADTVPAMFRYDVTARPNDDPR